MAIGLGHSYLSSCRLTKTHRTLHYLMVSSTLYAIIALPVKVCQQNKDLARVGNAVYFTGNSFTPRVTGTLPSQAGLPVLLGN